MGMYTRSGVAPQVTRKSARRRSESSMWRAAAEGAAGGTGGWVGGRGRRERRERNECGEEVEGASEVARELVRVRPERREAVPPEDAVRLLDVRPLHRDRLAESGEAAAHGGAGDIPERHERRAAGDAGDPSRYWCTPRRDEPERREEDREIRPEADGHTDRGRRDDERDRAAARRGGRAPQEQRAQRGQRRQQGVRVGNAAVRPERHRAHEEGPGDARGPLVVHAAREEVEERDGRGVRD